MTMMGRRRGRTFSTPAICLSNLWPHPHLHFVHVSSLKPPYRKLGHHRSLYSHIHSFIHSFIHSTRHVFMSLMIKCTFLLKKKTKKNVECSSEKWKVGKTNKWNCEFFLFFLFFYVQAFSGPNFSCIHQGP